MAQNPVTGTNGADNLFGTTGDDIINPRQSDPNLGVGDLVDGGQGFDTLLVDASLSTRNIFSGTFLDNGGFTVFFLQSERGSGWSGPFFWVEQAKGIQQLLITGGSGADVLVGLNNADEADPDSLGDELFGMSGNDRIDGKGGHDKVFGYDDNDVLFGGTGNDTLWGGNGIDELHGGAGADRLYVSIGSDTLDGGTGADYADFSLFNPQLKITVSLAQGWATVQGVAGYHMLKSIEIIIANDADDLLVGNRFNNGFSGHRGNDSIHGGRGKDTLLGGDGHDLLFGGPGNDYIEGNQDNDRIYGEAGADNLRGGAGSDRIFGGMGGDSMSGHGLSDDDYEFSKNDTFVYTSRHESKKGIHHDIIYDFHGGEDKIDLRKIDANENVDGNQTFGRSIGTTFHNKAGELRYTDAGMLQGDVNGDGKPDFEIYLYGIPDLFLTDILR